MIPLKFLSQYLLSTSSSPSSHVPKTDPDHIWRLVVTAARPTIKNSVWHQPSMSARIVKKLAKQIRVNDDRVIPEFYEWANQQKVLAEFINSVKEHILYQKRVEKWNKAAEEQGPSPLLYKPEEPAPVPELPPNLAEWIFGESRLHQKDSFGNDLVPAPGVPPWLNVAIAAHSRIKAHHDVRPEWSSPIFPWNPISNHIVGSVREEFFSSSNANQDAFNLFLATVPPKPQVKTGVRRLRRAKGHKWERDLPKRLASIAEKLANSEKTIAKHKKSRPKHQKVKGIMWVWQLGQKTYGGP